MKIKTIFLQHTDITATTDAIILIFYMYKNCLKMAAFQGCRFPKRKCSASGVPLKSSINFGEYVNSKG